MHYIYYVGKSMTAYRFEVRHTSSSSSFLVHSDDVVADLMLWIVLNEPTIHYPLLGLCRLRTLHLLRMGAH